MSESPESEHGRLQREALALWGAGRLDQARVKYAAAIERAPPTHHAVGDYHLAYAGVLAGLNQHEAARTHYERGLEIELVLNRNREPSGDTSTAVAVARCLLGQHCVQTGDYAAALAAVHPSISADSGAKAPLLTVRALGYAGLGRTEDARTSAAEALNAAVSDAQRAGVLEALGELADQR